MSEKISLDSSVILAKYRVACFYENGFYDREERR